MMEEMPQYKVCIHPYVTLAPSPTPPKPPFTSTKLPRPCAFLHCLTNQARKTGRKSEHFSLDSKMALSSLTLDSHLCLLTQLELNSSQAHSVLTKRDPAIGAGP